MESSLKKIEQNNCELTIEVGPEELADYVKAAKDRIAKEVKLDGFRKGKAPQDLIRQKVGDQHILEEALDIALQDSLAKTIAKDELEVIKVSDLTVKENSAKKLVYTVKVTLFPSVKIGDLSKFRVSRKEISVDQKDIQEALEFIRSSRAKFVPKQKSAQKGDRVEIDFEVTSGGLPIEGGMSKNHPVVIGDSKFIPGFEDQLIGMQSNEEKTFSLTAPKDYFHKAVAGRNLEFKVKMVSVQEIDKPVLNDDFAKTLGNFKNIKELEQNVKEGIFEEKKMKEQQRLRLEILNGIYERSKVELPKEMITQRLDDMIARFDGELHMKGLELSIYLAHLSKTEDDLRNDWRSEAEKHVAFSLIVQRIAKDNNISLNPEELEDAVNQTVQAMIMRGEIEQDKVNLEAMKDKIAESLVNEKVMAHLINNYVK